MQWSSPVHLLVPLLLGVCGCRSTEPVPSEPRQEAQAVAASQPPLSPADLEFQKLLSGMGVRFFPAEKLEISGWVNMQTGLIEVFACAPQGKTHESVVVLDCIPSGLQAGLMALGLEPGTPVDFARGGTYKPPTGAPVDIEVRWIDASGEEHLAFAEDWIWDQKRMQPMSRSAWIFAGSFLQEIPGKSAGAAFAADQVKSLVTTYHDASSILETSEVDGIDDTVYYSNEQAVPPVGTRVTAIFRRAR